MSQPAVLSLPFEIIYDDGIPLESNWHVTQGGLLKGLILWVMKERGRSDFFTGCNMFVYYSYDQARAIAADLYSPYLYRGPDVFYVGGVEARNDRQCWIVWQEGRFPEIIFEFLSFSTAKIDRTFKKDLYANTFRTPEYFLYDPDGLVLEGFRLAGNTYQPIAPNVRGHLWSERLGLYLGPWRGVQAGFWAEWVRLFHPDGRLVLTPEEHLDIAECEAEAAKARADAAEAEIDALKARVAAKAWVEATQTRAEAERQRADAAEAELARLRARLGEGSGG